jgi:hypothetical protein
MIEPSNATVADQSHEIVPSRPAKFRAVGMAVSLFFVVLGLKWAVVDRYASELPDWDQWDAEGLHLFQPWFEGRNFFRELFLPHNEHRIVVTKLQNLGVLLLNGQWDSRLECVVNAMVHSALAVALFVFGRRWIAARWHVPWFVLCAAFFGPPLAWQNNLGGFHSPQYWLLLLSFATIATLPFARPGSVAWWLATIGAALALGTLGSGFVAAFVAGGLVLWRVWRREIMWRTAFPTLIVCAIVCAVGILTRVEVHYHQVLKAKSAGDFFLSISRSLQWPAPRAVTIAPFLLWLPWVLAVWRVMTSRASSVRGGQIIVGLGVWTLIQIVATAYARGAGGDHPASRYMDTLAFGSIANVLALGWLMTHHAPTTSWKRGLAFLGLGWLSVAALGISEILERNLGHELPDTQGYYRAAEANVRNYVATGDRRHFDHGNVPFPSVEDLISRLTHSHLRKILPAVVRAPLPLRAESTEVSGFVSSGISPATPPLKHRTTWGSFNENGPVTTGSWQSRPLRLRGGWIKFEIAGQPGADDIALDLFEAGSPHSLAKIRPSKNPDDSWQSVYVRAPDVEFVVRAKDASAVNWVAFSQPVEVAWLSYWGWRAAQNGLLIAGIAALAAGVLGLTALRTKR